jgi:hypothetical protein
MKPRPGLSAGRQRNAATRGKEEEAGLKRQGTAGDGGTALQNPAGLGTGTCQGADYIVKKKIKEKGKELLCDFSGVWTGVHV